MLNALKGIATGQVSPPLAHPLPVIQNATQAFNKKRTRDSDLLEPLRPDVEEPVPLSLDFHDILDPEVSPLSPSLPFLCCKLI